MKKTLFLLMLIATGTHADPFAQGNADNGKKLFAKYQCSSCHEARVGGDGSAIFTRADRTVNSADDMLVQMTRCSGAIGKQLTAQEKQDLAAWLNQRYYHLK